MQIPILFTIGIVISKLAAQANAVGPIAALCYCNLRTLLEYQSIFLFGSDQPNKA